jgi:dolichyl-phosphate beta-glucosyltransferase
VCAVREGILAARGEIVIFADANLSWPRSAVERLAGMIVDDVAVAIGSREGVAAQRVGEPAYRHVADTQCGLKAFRADAADEIFRRQRLDGFAFDVEVLCLARAFGHRIVEVPIRWEHRAESRVRPIRVAFAMLRDVLVVRLTVLRGGYRARRGVNHEPASRSNRDSHVQAWGRARAHPFHRSVAALAPSRDVASEGRRCG